MTRALLLQGMLADRRVWRDVLPELAHLDCQLVELPGHGRAPAWSGQDYQDQALALLEAHAEGPVHLIGHSFGATVALRFAVEHPDRLTSLTLIDPVFFHAARQTDTAAYEAYVETGGPVIDNIRAGDTRRAAELFLAQWGLPGTWDALPRVAQDEIAGQMHLIDASSASLIDDTGQIWPRLERIMCPVLLVTGLRSHPVMAAIARALEQNMRVDARLALEDAGHMIPLSHGRLLGQQIALFTA